MAWFECEMRRWWVCKCARERSTPVAWLAACIFGDVFEEDIYNGCMMRRGRYFVG